MKVKALPNYLNVTMTPSNPILHTSRLYSLFGMYDSNHIYDSNPLFYGSWDLKSSKILISCDKELKCIKDRIRLDLSGVRSLLEHYTSNDVESLTSKISSISSLHNILSPMIKTNNGYLVDWNSRYFEADFPNGIVILKAIALLCAVQTPCIDSIIFWYQNMSNKEFLLDSKTFGKDILECNIPQNYGIKTLTELEKYYY